MSSAQPTETETEFVTDLTRLLSLEHEWDSLVARVPDAEVFATFPFVLASCRWLHPDARLHVLVFRTAGRVVGIAPFVCQTRGVLKVIQFIGHGSADYGDVLVEGAFRDVFGDLLRTRLHGLNLVLRNVRADSPNRCLFEGLTRGQYLVCAQNPFVAIAGAVTEYLSGTRKRVVQDGRRQLRRLQDLGSVTFTSVTSETEVAPALDALVTFKSQRRYRHDVAINPFKQTDRRRFLEEVCQATLRRGQLRLELLRLNDVPIAAHVGIVFRDKFYYFLPGFSYSHARYSPGRLLMQRAIELSFQGGLREFDFLNGDELYKHEWSTQIRETLTFHSLRPAALSWIYGWWYGRLKPALRSRQPLFMLVRRLRTGRLG
jgi:CelD/BcsL family acetyltransferase involved in cellulose biosynthesis